MNMCNCHHTQGDFLKQTWAGSCHPSTLICSCPHQPFFCLRICGMRHASSHIGPGLCFCTAGDNPYFTTSVPTHCPSGLSFGITSLWKPCLLWPSSCFLSTLFIYQSTFHTIRKCLVRKHLFCLQFCPQGLTHSWYYIKCLLKDPWINHLKLLEYSPLPSAGTL